MSIRKQLDMEFKIYEANLRIQLLAFHIDFVLSHKLKVTYTTAFFKKLVDNGSLIANSRLKLHKFPLKHDELKCRLKGSRTRHAINFLCKVK